MGWLLTGDEPDEKVRAQTETELALLEAMRTLTHKQQLTIIKMVELLLAGRDEE